MFDEWRQLIEFFWVLGAPVLGGQADGALVAMGLGAVALFSAAIAAVVMALLVRRPIAVLPRGPRRLAGRCLRSRPPGPRHPCHTARPRAPGAALA